MDDGLFVLKAMIYSMGYLTLMLIETIILGIAVTYILTRIAKRWIKVIRKAKGNWYYEVQCLMLVFMWQYDMTHKPIKTRGVWLGRFHIWYDTAWTTHGIAGDIRYILTRVWSTITGIVPEIIKFNRSMSAYLHLYRAGLTISHHEYSENWHMNRFYWKGKMIPEVPDIDMVDGHYNTLNNGHVERLK